MNDHPHDPNMFIIWCKAFGTVVGLFILLLFLYLGLMSISIHWF